VLEAGLPGPEFWAFGLLWGCDASAWQSPGMDRKPIRMPEKIPRTCNGKVSPPRLAVYRNRRTLRRARRPPNFDRRQTLFASKG